MMAAVLAGGQAERASEDPDSPRDRCGSARTVTAVRSSRVRPAERRSDVGVEQHAAIREHLLQRRVERDPLEPLAELGDAQVRLRLWSCTSAATTSGHAEASPETAPTAPRSIPARTNGSEPMNTSMPSMR